jgi:hypothetical protein
LVRPFEEQLEKVLSALESVRVFIIGSTVDVFEQAFHLAASA